MLIFFTQIFQFLFCGSGICFAIDFLLQSNISEIIACYYEIAVLVNIEIYTFESYILIQTAIYAISPRYRHRHQKSI